MYTCKRARRYRRIWIGGVLAGIDRRILSGVGNDELHQMVRVLVVAATWSTWRRHCTVSGVSMGSEVVGSIGHEFDTIAGQDKDDRSVFSTELTRKLVAHGKLPRRSRSTPQRPGTVARSTRAAAEDRGDRSGGGER